MRAFKAFSILSLFLCFFVSIKAQTPKSIYDARKEHPAAKVAPADEKLLRTAVLPKASAFWKDAEGCEESFSILDVTHGAITGPGTDQKAFLYSFCETGHNFSKMGIAVVENGKIIAHYAYEGGGELSISSLPDIDGDGINELVIEAGGTNQGITWGTVAIIELSPKSVKKFGNTQTYEDNCGAVEKGCETKGFQILAASGAKPIFYHQKYTQLGKIWKPAGKQLIVKMDVDEIKYTKLN